MALADTDEEIRRVRREDDHEEARFTRISPVTRKLQENEHRPEIEFPAPSRRSFSFARDAAYNEEQGKASVRKVQEEKRLREEARAAHREGIEESRRQIREQANRAASAFRIRTLSGNVVSVPRRASSPVSTNDPPAQQSPLSPQQSKRQQKPHSQRSEFPPTKVTWDPSAQTAKADGDIFFDAETGEMVSDNDDQSSIHGGTRPVTLAPTIVSLTGSHSGSFAAVTPTFYNLRRPSIDAGNATAAESVPVTKKSSVQSRRSNKPQSQIAKPSSKQGEENPFDHADDSQENLNLLRKDLPQKPTTTDWVPSSRPPPTIPTSYRKPLPTPRSVKQREPVSSSATPPLLPPIETSTSFISSLFDNASLEERPAGREEPAQASLLTDEPATVPSPPPAYPLESQATGVASPLSHDSKRPARPRQNTNPFRNGSMHSPRTTELPYLADATDFSPAAPSSALNHPGATSPVIASPRIIDNSPTRFDSGLTAFSPQVTGTPYPNFSHHQRAATMPNSGFGAMPTSLGLNGHQPASPLQQPSSPSAWPMNPFSEHTRSLSLDVHGELIRSPVGASYAAAMPQSSPTTAWTPPSPKRISPGSNNPYHLPPILPHSTSSPLLMAPMLPMSPLPPPQQQQQQQQQFALTTQWHRQQQGNGHKRTKIGEILDVYRSLYISCTFPPAAPGSRGASRESVLLITQDTAVPLEAHDVFEELYTNPAISVRANKVTIPSSESARFNRLQELLC